MVLKGIEAALEKLVEGTFSRAFKSELQPLELGKKLIKELEAGRKLDVNGRAITPNNYVISVSESDYESLGTIEVSLLKELHATARTYVQEKELGFVGPLEITIVPSDQVKVGLCKLHPTFDENLDATTKSDAILEGLGGISYELYLRVMTIGRNSDCDIVLADDNVSRRHVELIPSADSFEISDLSSTNGIKVNGQPCGRAVLRDGDEIEVGTVKLWFRQ